jgi:hypothetical protein
MTAPEDKIVLNRPDGRLTSAPEVNSADEPFTAGPEANRSSGLFAGGTPASAELVPVTTPDEIAALPDEQRGQMITRALVESKSWLAVATKGADPAPIAEFRAWAATVAEMTRQKGLAEEIQLDALEMVRRAERGIGMAIRNGQEAGEIATTAESKSYAGKVRHQQLDEIDLLQRKPTPSDFVGIHQLSPNDGTGIYALTDGVTDDVFEDVLIEARQEKNLTRANVARKATSVADPRTKLPRKERLVQIAELAEQKLSSGQIAQEIGVSENQVRRLARANNIPIPVDDMIRGSQGLTINPVQVLRSTVEDLAYSMNVTASLIGTYDFDRLDPVDARDWAQSLDKSLNYLRKLRRELNRRGQQAA